MATITLDIDKLAADLQRTADVIEKAFHSERLKKRIAEVAVAGIKEGFNKGISPDGVSWKPPLLRNGKPLLDTGRTRASIRGGVTADSVVVSANGVQARILNEGGVITAKRGKYLAIPLTTEARRAGSPRAMQGLHFQGKKGGNSGAMVNKEGVAQFALKTSVTIPARPFLGFSQEVLRRAEALIVDEIVKALGGN